MPGQPTDESAARAARLREEIERLTRKGDKSPQESGASNAEDSQRPLTPRDYIQERMRELDEKKGD